MPFCPVYETPGSFYCRSAGLILVFSQLTPEPKMKLAPASNLNAAQYALWVRQLEEWEDSVFLTPDEFVDALSAKNARYTNLDGTKIDTPAAIARYRKHYPDAVPYLCGKNQQYLGLRYGHEGHEYLSF